MSKDVFPRVLVTIRRGGDDNDSFFGYVTKHRDGGWMYIVPVEQADKSTIGEWFNKNAMNITIQ